MTESPKVPTIGLYVPTRGRLQTCVASLTAWKSLAADPGNIRFLIGVDHDDDSASKVIRGEGLQVHVFDESVITCGGRVKVLADLLDVDIYLATVDYYFPTKQYWDNNLRQALFGGGHEIVNCLYEPAPSALHLTACSKRWMKLANKYEPEIFPCWFSDQWRIEMHSYVFNCAPPTINTVTVGGAHNERTQNMHEIDFWWGLFHALRPRRLLEAYEVYKGYGLSAPTFEKFVDSRRDMIDMFLRVDAGKRKQLQGYQELFGQQGAKSEKYKRVKANADALIEREGLELWQMKFNRCDGTIE